MLVHTLCRRRGGRCSATTAPTAAAAPATAAAATRCAAKTSREECRVPLQAAELVFSCSGAVQRCEAWGCTASDRTLANCDENVRANQGSDCRYAASDAMLVHIPCRQRADQHLGANRRLVRGGRLCDVRRGGLRHLSRRLLRLPEHRHRRLLVLQRLPAAQLRAWQLQQLHWCVARLDQLCLTHCACASN